MLNQPCIKFSVENFSSLVLYLYSLKIKIIKEMINKKKKQFPKFFKNAPCVIDISNLTDSDYVYWQETYHSILNMGLHIVGVSGHTNKKWKLILIKNNIPIVNQANSMNKIIKPKKKFNQIYNNFVIDKPVRSGQVIYAQNKNLIIISTVNSGAEIIADGNIYVYGSLRGKASAGASSKNNQKYQIFCTQLLAEFISISGKYWVNETIPKLYLGKPARFFLKKNILTIQKFSL
ncbi:MAG: septum site-determining protein MinC [Wigglesworthia glossinidia]|nr:septum site-determining protein MinC [Wigglesworthia glossinidia]